MNWLGLIDCIDNNIAADVFLKDWLQQNGIYEIVLGDWWPHRGENPSWSIEARPCGIEDDEGLLLIETRVPDSSGKHLAATASHDSQMNHIQILNAIAQAAASLQLATNMPGDISRDQYYQLSNRIAWAWRLATRGISVVLYYHGYQNGNQLGVVPNEWWGSWLNIDNNQGETTPLLLLPREYETCPAVIAARQPQDPN